MSTRPALDLQLALFGPVLLLLAGCGGSVETATRDAGSGTGSVASGSSSGGGSSGSGSSGASGGTATDAGGSGGGGSGGGGREGDGGNGGGNGGRSSSGGASSGAAQYPGHGFIVHEWGTDTTVVGSDGSLQRGLHHEEEDLPAFVYDRVKAARAAGMSAPSVEVKMETPVTYFYSDAPLAVSASVAFPKGVFTQWYPAVTGFLPSVSAPGSETASPTVPADFADPVLDVSFPFSSQTCRDHYTQVAGGRLDWGAIEVLDPMPKAALPDAPLAQFSWGYARQVASNPVRSPAGELEQFLFYRGLGSFDPPAHVTVGPAGALTVSNGYTESLGPVFVLDVGALGGAFTVHAEGIAPSESLSDSAPSLDGAPSLDTYAQALGDAVVQALDGAGLYHDESIAMVNTWKRQWFRTPGVRVLYLAPQSWTDASIPITLQPQPDGIARVMLMRVEVITPELEAADTAAAQLLASASTSPTGASYFMGLGRFAEPRLRRALALLGGPSYGDALLSQIATAATDVSSGE
jgi:hypothetical protein